MKQICSALLLGALLIGAPHAATLLDANGPVETVGEASPDMVKLVAAYERLHDQVTPEGVDALFAPGFMVFGSSLPPAGLQRDGVIQFLSTLRGTTFRQKPGVPLLITKDGRIVMQWTLKAGERQLASGVDYITVENGRIRKIVGIY